MAKVDQCIDACQLEQEAKGDDIILSEMQFDDTEKLPLLPSPNNMARLPLGHVWDVLLPDSSNRKGSVYDSYVKRLPTPFGAFLPEAKPCPGASETPPSKMEVVEAVEPVLFGAVVPESRSEKLIRAEVEGVPFEVVVRVPFWAKPGQIIDVNLGAHSEYEVVVPPGFGSHDLIPYCDPMGQPVVLRVPEGLVPGERFRSVPPRCVTVKAPAVASNKPLAFRSPFGRTWLCVGPFPWLFPGECFCAKLPPGDLAAFAL